MSLARGRNNVSTDQTLRPMVSGILLKGLIGKTFTADSHKGNQHHCQGGPKLPNYPTMFYAGREAKLGWGRGEREREKEISCSPKLDIFSRII